MVELPRGDVKESRRGGAGVLELLLVDMQTRSESGFIRCEATSLGGAVGQIIVREGNPSMVLFEGADGNRLIGHAAVGALQEAAGLEGSQLSLHQGVDLDLIEDLYPLARLHLDEGETLPWSEAGEAEAWWRRRQRTRREWKKLDVWTPDGEGDAPSLSTVELPPLPFHPGSELLPGMVALVDTSRPDDLMRMAAHLGSIGHPLLVISRLPTVRLETEVGLPASVTVWLTEKGTGEQAMSATLEEVRQRIDGFLFGSSRACILLDGLEFLSGLHGFDRMADLLRSLIDSVTSSDHLLLLPVDLDVWDERQRTILLREVDRIDSTRVSGWASRPARMEGHPFCSDDWSGVEIPAPAPPEPIQTPKPVSVEVSSSEEANRWSISGVVDAWREERHAEVKEVAEGGIADSSEAELPEWATAPSANRDDSTVPATPETAPTVESEPVSIPQTLETPPPEAPKPKPKPKAKAKPKAATVNHRGNAPRRVRRTQKTRDGMPFAATTDVGTLHDEDPNQLVKAGMDLAATRARDVDARVILPEDVVKHRDGLDSASGRSRLISSELEGGDQPDMRIAGMTAASRAAAGSNVPSEAPPLTSNVAVREASSRAQRTEHLTSLLAMSEKASIRTMQAAFPGSGGAEVTVWKRIRNLQALGIDVQSIIDRFETDPGGALIELEEAER